VAGLTQIGDADFEQEVLRSERPVVVDFWAPWCGPCRVIGPILEDMAAEHGDRVRFVALNVDENPVTQTRYGVLSIPTVIVFDGAEPRETVLGARPRRAYEAALEPWLSAAAS
jgi:thioredoxin 1